MKKSELYAFAQLFLNHPAAALKLIFKPNFIVHELAQLKLSLELELDQKHQRLNLSAHHLSFYKEIDPENPNLSEYHYTAYFTSAAKEYQLHVYFNGKNEIVGLPQLGMKQADGSYKSIKLTEEANQTLENLALKQSARVIGNFRALYDKQMQTDLSRYEEQVAKAELLSKDLVKNPEAYLAEIKNTISVLKDLLKYQRNYHYYSMLRLFQTTYANVKHQYKQVTLESKRTVETDNSSDDELELIEEYKALSPKVLKPEDSISAMLAKAQEAFDAFEALKGDRTIPAETYAQTINKAYQLAMSVLLFVTKDNCNADELAQLRELVQKNQKNRQHLLELFLLKGEFEASQILLGVNADKERQLPHFVLAKFVEIALKFRNARLLDFLLSTHPFPLNTFLINEQALAVFCISQHSKQKPMTQCLSALIKHGLSLNALDPATKLPIIHVILSTPNHTLRPALVENKELTTLNKHFYSNLAKQLHEVKLSASVSQAQVLERSIAGYRRAAVSLGAKLSKGEKMQYVKFTDLKEQILQRYNSEEQLMLCFDSEILEKSTLYAKAEREYVRCLPKAERMKLNQRAIHLYNTIDQMLADRSAMSLGELRRRVLTHFEEQIEFCHAMTRLTEVQKKLKSTPVFIGKGNGARAELQREEALLIEQVNRLSLSNRLESAQKIDERMNAGIWREASRFFDGVALNKASFFNSVLSELDDKDFEPEEEFDKDAAPECF